MFEDLEVNEELGKLGKEQHLGWLSRQHKKYEDEIKKKEKTRKLRIFIKIQGISNDIHRDVVDLDFFEGNLGGSGVCDAPIKDRYFLTIFIKSCQNQK